MKKFTLLFVSAFIIQATVSSQSCLPEGITFTTQAQIDNFQTNYPNCTEIEGDVIISGNYIANLNGLGVLTSIAGNISIYDNDPLISLTGLDNLTSIGGNLVIGTIINDMCQGNDALTSLTGLDNLSSIVGSLNIICNEALTSLTGLVNLSSIGNSFIVKYNITLTSLTGLEGLNTIGGDLSIRDNDALTSLTGLNSVTSIGGLSIRDNDALTSLTGLDNVTSIEGIIKISYNDVLASLTGLDNVTSIGDVLWLLTNPSLTSLTGLDNLTYIGGKLFIYDNDALTNLTGLDNLNFIGGDLLIYYNGALISLTGLGGVTSIGGNFLILYNPALTSLTDLDNLDSIGEDLEINHNSSLATCDVQSICDYLTSPNGYISIYDNAPGCNSQEEVEEDCENNCLPEGILFTTQAEVDNFQINYPGCTEIEGDVEINGGDITNLYGLYVLTAIRGNLSIWGDNALTSLMGLEDLTSVWGHLSIIDNASLTSLTGMDNLTFIGGDIDIYSNDVLTSLTGLDYVTSIGGNLSIWGNNVLTGLTGLGNINAASITNLYIYDNSSLATCEVQSICYYLISPNGYISIYDNAPGCNSQEEVEEACKYNCLPGGILFTSQARVDNFQINYPYCTGIEGDVKIKGGDITNLNGLNVLTAIGGDLSICGNNVLTSLTGLDNLDSIGGVLVINNNDALTSLTGLENINAASITNLNIYDNSTLATCEVQSICDYLASPSGAIVIQRNATGCNSNEEVRDACAYGLEENIKQDYFSVYPNPLTNLTTLEYKLKEPAMVSLIIYNHLGQKIETLVNQQQSQGKHQVTWDAKGLQAGLYFFRLIAGNQTASGKMIVVK